MKSSRPEPVIAYRHPILDRRLHLPADYPVLTDEQLDRLCDDFVRAARLAQRIGFEFVDIKHCHGYLGHELLSAVDRPGRYGCSFENRTRFLRQIAAGIRAEAPGLGIAVRVSISDTLPFRSGPNGLGEPEPLDEIRHSSFDIRHSPTYPYAFGGDGTGLGFDLSEPRALLDLFRTLGIRLVCITIGSPYYNPHIQRPALFPPSDGYLPPEDPLIGVAKHLHVTAELKRHAPDLVLVGSGYTYLQEWLPHVAQAAVRRGETDFVGLGAWSSATLSYPPTCWPATPSAASSSAARSANAPPPPATAWCPAAIRSTRTTSSFPKPKRWRKSGAGSRTEFIPFLIA